MLTFKNTMPPPFAPPPLPTRDPLWWTPSHFCEEDDWRIGGWHGSHYSLSTSSRRNRFLSPPQTPRWSHEWNSWRAGSPAGYPSPDPAHQRWADPLFVCRGLPIWFPATGMVWSRDLLSRRGILYGIRLSCSEKGKPICEDDQRGFF